MYLFPFHLRPRRPSNHITFFITIIVKHPVVQVLSLTTGLALLALEFPLPLLRHTPWALRNMVLRVIILIIQAVLLVLLYQVRLHRSELTCFILFKKIIWVEL
jgi:hypothetical protein